MVAGGSGITPMLQVIMHILKNPDDKTKICLVFGNVSEADIICRAELDALATAHAGRFNVEFILSERVPSTTWTGLTGRVDRALLEKVFV